MKTITPSTKKSTPKQGQAYAQLEAELEIIKLARRGSREGARDAQHNLLVAVVVAAEFLDDSAASQTMLLTLARELSGASMETFQKARATVETEKAQAERDAAGDRCHTYALEFLPRFQELLESGKYIEADAYLLERSTEIAQKRGARK